MAITNSFDSFTMKGVIQMGNVCQASWNQVVFFACLFMFLLFFSRWAKLRQVCTQVAKIQLNRNMLNSLKVQGRSDSQGSEARKNKLFMSESKFK